jgi:hypothetical protein
MASRMPKPGTPDHDEFLRLLEESRRRLREQTGWQGPIAFLDVPGYERPVPEAEPKKKGRVSRRKRRP